MKKFLSVLMLLLLVAVHTWAVGTAKTLPTSTGSTLSNGCIYTVASSVTINSNGSYAGLTVASNSTVTIYIPKNVTLTVNGSGRYAGIYIPSSSTLIITGEGTLNATSGKPSYGGAGTKGGNGYFSGDYACTGGGGTGGAGGYGAGAAIGGNGGAGGSAKGGPGGSSYYCQEKAYYGPGSNTGNNGGSGSTMGNMYIMGTVTVNATKTTGKSGSSPTQEGWGSQSSYTWSNTYFAGGGGPGGNGGPGASVAYAIGGGAYGGGSGASGAAGGVSWHKKGNSNYKNCIGSSGGYGAGDGQSRSYGSRTGSTTQGEGSDVRWGGASAYGGYAGSNGGNGTVYKLTATYNNPSISGAASTSNTSSYPAQVQATLSFDANKGTGAAANRTVYYGVKMANVNVPTRGDASGNYQFLGYYTAATGGTKVFNADGTPVSVSTIAANSTLYAHWQGTKFTFMNGDATVKTTTFVTIPSQLDDSYKADAGSRPNPYFCGYYTASGVQVFDHNLNFKASSVTFADAETLYAQFICSQHTVVWDYSYRFDAAEYKNLDEHNRYGRLVFKNATGGVIKTVYLTADAVDNKDASTITGSIDTHTTSQMVVDLLVGNSTDVVTGTNAQIYFTQAQLESMRGYQFDVWTTADASGAKADHWSTNTNPTAHKTIFSYRGAISENMFWLSWNVTLDNLAMYPDKVYAKPMIQVDGQYQEIDEMRGTYGEECFETSRIGTTGAGSSVTYSGEIPVLKNQTGGTAASYKIGMTGFYLAGGNYFLNATQGDVSSDFISTDVISFNGSGNAPDSKINYTIHDYDIPVVLLLPAAPTSEVTDAQINHLPQILYVDQARATKVNLSNFVAERPHFDFAGWYDTEWTENGTNKIWGADEDYYFHTHTSPNGGTRTLIALWTRSTAPEASVEMTEETDKFKYTITATDDVAVKAVKYLITDTEPTAQSTDWETVDENNNEYVVTISRNNDDYGKCLYIMVENEGKNVIVKYEDPIRSFLDIKANPDPDSRVEDTYTYYSTYYNSQQAYKLTDATAYTLNAINSNNTLMLTPISPNENGETILPKDEAVLLQSPTSTITLELVDSNAEKSDDNCFEGVDEATEQDGDYDYYIFTYAQYGLGFYLNSTNQLAAHKAFIKLDKDSNNARAFTLNFGDLETTAIRDVETTAVETTTLYDLSGRQMSKGNLRSGIYVKGGKKIMIK